MAAREEIALGADAYLYHWPEWLAPERADRLFRDLYDNIPWRQETVVLFGRRHAVPRLQAWCGDPGAGYSYSGLHLAPQPWLPALQAVRLALSRLLSVDFNGVLVNLYRNGRDSMGWHSDNEPELGCRPVIASVSLGARRRFRLRHIHDRQRTHALELEHGSLLVMGAGVQESWQHQLPRSAVVQEPRINMTFRYVQGAGVSLSASQAHGIR